MKNGRVKLVVAGFTVAAAVTLLAVAGMREGWVYYLPVDQFVNAEDQSYQRVRLHGIVGEQQFESNSALLLADFDLLGESQSIRVSYEGVIPDLFQPGREVVIEGNLGESGVFQADTLMTKCASKYSTEEGEAPHLDPRDEETLG